jgi:hypothetical protein
VLLQKHANRYSNVPGIEKFFDILEEVKKEEQTTIETLLVWTALGREDLTTYQKSIYIGAKGYIEKKVRKSIRGMPWLSEAMKDVISCDKPWGLANMN